jgi:small subunit ribosomal protein S16
VSVRIRMKQLGRKHRPYYRICAMDIREPRNGRVLEELGTYDPMIPETDARALLNSERIDFWISKGAQPSEKVKVLIKKYGASGTHKDLQRAALSKLAMIRRRPEPAAASAKTSEAKPAEAEEQSAPAEVAQENKTE